MSAPQAPETAGWKVRATELSRKVPTRWFVTALLVIFLAVSAAFGGLRDAPDDTLPMLDAGQAFTGAQLDIAVNRVALIDSFPEQNIEPETEGNRLLVVVATVTDVWNKPVASAPSLGAGDNIRPRGVRGIDAGTAPLALAVVNDGTANPTFQPDVPIEVAFIWEVAPDAMADGDTVRIDVYDKIYRASGFVTYGERFEDPFVAAYATVPVKDVGAGMAS